MSPDAEHWSLCYHVQHLRPSARNQKVKGLKCQQKLRQWRDHNNGRYNVAYLAQLRSRSYNTTNHYWTDEFVVYLD